MKKSTVNWIKAITAIVLFPVALVAGFGASRTIMGDNSPALVREVKAEGKKIDDHIMYAAAENLELDYRIVSIEVQDWFKRLSASRNTIYNIKESSKIPPSWMVEEAETFEREYNNAVKKQTKLKEKLGR